MSTVSGSQPVGACFYCWLCDADVEAADVMKHIEQFHPELFIPPWPEETELELARRRP